MAYVPVPKDLSKVKTKVAFNLTKRQILCFSVALLMGLPLFFLFKDSAGTSLAAMAMIVVMLPCFLVAMYEKHLVPVVLIPSGIMGLHPLASVMGIYPYISSDAAEMVKKWAGGIEITISPNICLISLLVIGSISAIVSVLALRKQTY